MLFRKTNLYKMKAIIGVVRCGYCVICGDKSHLFTLSLQPLITVTSANH